jgi:hypothetical protein
VLATALGLERPGAIRALAGRPTLYFQQTSPLPAVLVIAEVQATTKSTETRPVFIVLSELYLP